MAQRGRLASIVTRKRHQLSLIIMAQHGVLFAVLYEDNDFSEVLESEDDVVQFSVFPTFMKRSFKTHRLLDETVPAYFGHEFASHFRNTCELLTTEIVASGHINLGNEFGRAPIPPENKILVYLWMMAKEDRYLTSQ